MKDLLEILNGLARDLVPMMPDSQSREALQDNLNRAIAIVQGELSKQTPEEELAYWKGKAEGLSMSISAHMRPQ